MRKDSALSAPSAIRPSSPAFTPPAQPQTPFDFWRLEIRRRLRTWRTAGIAAGTWRHSKFESLPQPVWKVESAHSVSEAAIYNILRLIGQGFHNRHTTGAQSSITGRQVGAADSLEWHAIVSVHALAGLLTMPATTVERNLAGLERKHSVGRLQIRRRGERVGNREPSAYHVRTYDEVLKLRREDPNILTTHGEDDPKLSLQWHNGRANSRRFLRPDEEPKWNLRAMPAKPKTSKPAKHIAPADGDEQFAKAQPEEKPPAKPAPKDTPVQAAAAAKANIPPDQQAVLNQICSYVQGAAFQRDPATNRAVPTRIVDCDLAPKLLAAAQATAAANNKIFPESGIAELCTRYWEAKSKVQDEMVWNEQRQDYERMPVRIWTADMPAAYLLRCCANTEEPEKLLRFLDNLEGRAQEAAKKQQAKNREAHEKICRSLQLLREHPDDPKCLEFADSVCSAHPELYEKLWVEDDRRHGGDGAGSSWKVRGKKARLAQTPPLVAAALERNGGDSGLLGPRIYQAAVDQARQSGVAIADEIVARLIEQIVDERQARSLATSAGDILTTMPATAIAWARAERARQDKAPDAWELVKRELKAKLSLDSYLNWIHKTRGARIEDRVLVVEVASPEVAAWIKSEYSVLIGAILPDAEIAGVEYTVVEKNTPGATRRAGDGG